MVKDPTDQELKLKIRDHTLLINNIYMLPVSRFQQIQYFHISSNQNIMPIEGIRRIMVKDPTDQELKLKIRDHTLLINNIYQLPISRTQ